MNSQFDEKGKIYTNKVFKIPVLVKIRTLSHLIHGEVFIKPGERLKDEINNSEQFLAVSNASIYNDQGDKLFQSNFLIVNLDQMVWLIPEEENGSLPQYNSGDPG
jgi:hypothetical protein